jgi:hypothetical protein
VAGALKNARGFVPGKSEAIVNNKDFKDVSGSLSVVRPPVPYLRKGVCYVMFAFELGLSVKLEMAAQKLKQDVERTKFRRNRRAPKYFDYDPPPLRIVQHGQQINAGKFFTRPQAELTLFDFCLSMEKHLV